MSVMWNRQESTQCVQRAGRQPGCLHPKSHGLLLLNDLQWPSGQNVNSLILVPVTWPSTGGWERDKGILSLSVGNFAFRKVLQEAMKMLVRWSQGSVSDGQWRWKLNYGRLRRKWKLGVQTIPAGRDCGDLIKQDRGFVREGTPHIFRGTIKRSKSLIKALEMVTNESLSMSICCW
jgi:hypothetical protein